MSTLLTVDVETVPLVASLNAPYPEADRPFPANYKAEEAIAKWRAADRIVWQEQRVKECSLTPRLGRIACFGYAMDDLPAVARNAATEDEERALLDDFWALITLADRIVTFSGSFDLRFLVIRSAILDVSPSVHRVADWFRRYSTTPHFDTRAVLTGWDDRQPGRLSDWCAAFGIACDDQSSGADVYGLAQSGQWDAIARHCTSDVELTRALYKRVSPLFT